MRKGFKRYDIIVLGLLGCLVLILPLLRIVQAQHIDIFTLDKFAQKERPPEAPETGSVKVEDYYSYEVPVEKDKIDKGEVLRTDIDLVEFANEKVFISVAGLQLIPDCVSRTVQSLSLLEPSNVQAVG